jgi:antitoxin (DNA-binding transcriptional repressor) of toxin-antitoxin stability system
MMRFITVRDFRTKPAVIWHDLPLEQEMIITNNGKPIAILTPVSDTNLEDTLKSIRKARAMDAVMRMQQISLQNKNISMTDNELETIIAETRKQTK